MPSCRSCSLAVVLLATAAGAAQAQPSAEFATYITAQEIQDTVVRAPDGRVSDQQIRHIDAGDGYLGVGVVQRPPKAAGPPIGAIQHHKQAEMYRVVSGSGTLVTAPTMVGAKPLDPDGSVVRTLTGPSSSGVIVGGQSRRIGAGDVVIIPADVAHGFSEITETITYLVLRIDPEELVELK